jgi:hypothetical protein
MLTGMIIALVVMFPVIWAVVAEEISSYRERS